MATTLNIPKLLAEIDWNLSSGLSGFTNVPSFNDKVAYPTSTLGTGTGAGQADTLYVTKTTIAPSANLDLDLASGLTDVFGNAISFARVKAIYVEVTKDTAASEVDFGGGASNPFSVFLGTSTDKVKVRNGGVALLVAPDATAFAVNGSTAHVFRLTNADGVNTATVKVALVGASA